MKSRREGSRLQQPRQERSSPLWIRRLQLRNFSLQNHTQKTAVILTFPNGFVCKMWGIASTVIFKSRPQLCCGSGKRFWREICEVLLKKQYTGRKSPRGEMNTTRCSWAKLKKPSDSHCLATHDQTPNTKILNIRSDVVGHMRAHDCDCKITHHFVLWVEREGRAFYCECFNFTSYFLM